MTKKFFVIALSFFLIYPAHAQTIRDQPYGIGYINNNFLKLDCSNDPLTDNLEIRKSDATALLQLSRNQAAITSSDIVGRLDVYTYDTTNPGICARLEALSYGTSCETGWRFSCGTPSALTEVMQIDPYGFVGIGTAWPDSPDTLLHLSHPTDTYLRFTREDTTVIADEIIGKIEFENQDAGSSGIAAVIEAIAEGTDGETGLSLWTGTAGTLAERLRIDNTGDFNFQAGDLVTTGNINIDSDANKIFFGDGQDSSISYNGSDMTIWTDEVGSGQLIIRVDATVPQVTIYKDSFGISASSGLSFALKNTAEDITDYFQFYGRLVDPTDGSEDGEFNFLVRTNGALANDFMLRGGNAGFGTPTNATPYAKVTVRKNGTAKSTVDFFAFENSVSAADMDGTGTAIKWRQEYYDWFFPGITDSGRLEIRTEQDWTGTASTRDSAMVFSTSLNGTVGEKVRITSDGITLVTNKIAFTQTDFNEYIDSLADGYMDYGATTMHRFNIDVKVGADSDTDWALFFGGDTSNPTIYGMEDYNAIGYLGDNSQKLIMKTYTDNDFDDDETISLPDTAIGQGFVTCGIDTDMNSATFYFFDDAPEILSGSTDATTADGDGKLVIHDGGDSVEIKNTDGDNRQMTCVIWFMIP